MIEKFLFIYIFSYDIEKFHFYSFLSRKKKYFSMENSLKVRAIKVFCQMFERKSFLATKLSVYVQEQLRMKKMLSVVTRFISWGKVFQRKKEKYFHLQTLEMFSGFSTEFLETLKHCSSWFLQASSADIKPKMYEKRHQLKLNKICYAFR